MTKSPYSARPVLPTGPGPKGMRSFWSVFEEHHVAMLREALGAAASRPDLALPEVPARVPEGLRELCWTVRSALVDGRGEPYLEHLSQEAAAFVCVRLGPTRWGFLARRFQELCIGRLVTAYRQWPDRLAAALCSMLRFVEEGLPLFIHAWLDHAAIVARTPPAETTLGEPRAASPPRYHGGLLGAVLDVLPDGVVVCDATGDPILFNRAAERMIGLEAEVPRWSATPSPDEPLDAGALLRTLRDGGIAEADFTTAIAAPGGERLTVIGRPLRDEGGDVQGAVVVFRDAGAHGHVAEAPLEIGLVSLQFGGERQTLAGVADVSARLAAQEEVTRSLREKETLLKEIHHRVKNNLQIISSLLMLQSEQMPGERARILLAECVYRVRSMALIHQQLYGVDSLGRIDFGNYARSLADSLRAALSPGTRIEVRTEPVEVTVEHAVPLGLILNELITNAIKYGHGAARPEGEVGRCGPGFDVRIEVVAREGCIHVAVVDSGAGLPPGLSPSTAGTLGLQLVRSLTRQLRGQLVTDYDRGMRFEVQCALTASGG